FLRLQRGTSRRARSRQVPRRLDRFPARRRRRRARAVRLPPARARTLGRAHHALLSRPMNLPRPAVLLPLLFASVIAGFSFWLERRVNLLTQPPPVEPAGEIDLVSGELVVDVYSDAGLPMHHIEADHAVHYLAGDRTALERPRVTSL